MACHESRAQHLHWVQEQFVIATINTTSLQAHIHDICQMQAHVVVPTETRVKATQMQRLQEQAAEEGVL